MTDKAMLTELLEILVDMPGKIAPEQKSLVERLKREAEDSDNRKAVVTETSEERVERIREDWRLHWKAGRVDRLSDVIKRRNDFVIKRGIDIERAASVALVIREVAEGMDAAQAFAMHVAIGLMHEMVPDTIAKSILPYVKRIEALETQLEQRSYQGVWEEGKYQKHNWVTHGGSLWIAWCDTEGKPGQTDDWQLAAKRGRDGRDAR